MERKLVWDWEEDLCEPEVFEETFMRDDCLVRVVVEKRALRNECSK